MAKKESDFKSFRSKMSDSGSLRRRKATKKATKKTTFFSEPWEVSDTVLEKETDFISFQSKMSDLESLLSRTKATKTITFFSKPWKDSDVVLVVEDNEFHVHRCILSLQSPVFKTMFNGDFKDSKQDKIELKDDKYQAMLLFLQLLYPPNMLDEGNVTINDENILLILEVADKYAAISVIKQCMKETENLQPENTMRLLPYAARHKLPLEKMFDVVAQHISTDALESFSPKLDASVYTKALATKCRLQENVVKRAHTTMIDLLQKYVEAEMDKKNDTSSVSCARHNFLKVQNFKEARKCENCLEVYKKYFIDKYVCSRTFRSKVRDQSQPASEASEDLIKLLTYTDNIATSLQS